MATTTNYGWDTPDDTDLVKDGAAAIRTLGSSIDTTTKNLNPQTTTGAIAYRSATANVNTALPIGTTGQVLTVAAGVPSWAAPVVGGGKVLQVLQTLKLDTFTSNSTTAVDITGLSVTITPAAATSKILVLVTITGNGKNASNGSMFRLLRDSTDIVVPTSPGSRSSGFGGIYINDEAQQGATSVSCLDSPNTTAATTYKVQGFCVAVGNGFFVNRSAADTNNSGFVRSASSITVLEIGA